VERVPCRLSRESAESGTRKPQPDVFMIIRSSRERCVSRSVSRRARGVNDSTPATMGGDAAVTPR
jgi:hypothetical protein